MAPDQFERRSKPGSPREPRCCTKVPSPGIFGTRECYHNNDRRETGRLRPPALATHSAPTPAALVFPDAVQVLEGAQKNFSVRNRDRRIARFFELVLGQQIEPLGVRPKYDCRADLIRDVQPTSGEYE